MAALTLNSITSVTLPGPFGLFLVILGGLIGSAAVWIAVDYTRVLRLRAKMPPGPFPYPVVGNVGRVPARKPWIAFERWSQEYKSPIVTIWTGNSPTVIVNDCWTASDLMEKRANIYSSRPHMVLVGDMLDETENNQTTMVYGDTWRLHRKIMASLLLTCYLASLDNVWYSIRPLAVRRCERTVNSKRTSLEYWLSTPWKDRMITSTQSRDTPARWSRSSAGDAESTQRMILWRRWPLHSCRWVPISPRLHNIWLKPTPGWSIYRHSSIPCPRSSNAKGRS